MNSGSITLGRLVDNIMSIEPEDLSARRLQKELAAAPLDLAFLKDKDRSCPILYTRNLVLRNPLLEVLLVNWGPGQVSPIHDHGESYGAVLTIKGELGCTRYEVQENQAGGFTLKEGDTRLYGPGEAGTTEKGEVHKQGNFQPTGEVISLHFYIKPLKTLQIYDADSGECREAELHYCLGESTCRYVLEGGDGPCTRS